jgi:protein SCO1
MGSWFSIARIGSAALAACAVFTLGCQSQEKKLPEYGAVPEFTLTAQNGHQFDSRSLTGDVWVADFFFTHCTGPCPRMSSEMHRIQTAFNGRKDLKLVSFTVDPDRDTPTVLATYAREFSADPARWTFLTGSMSELNHLCRDVFLLGEVDGKLNHSTRFVLVDRNQHVRGYYLSGDAGVIPHVISDIKVLLKERA